MPPLAALRFVDRESVAEIELLQPLEVLPGNLIPAPLEELPGSSQNLSIELIVEAYIGAAWSTIATFGETIPKGFGEAGMKFRGSWRKMNVVVDLSSATRLRVRGRALTVSGFYSSGTLYADAKFLVRQINK